MDSTERHTISGGYEIARPPAPRARYLWEMATDAWYETEAGGNRARAWGGARIVLLSAAETEGVSGAMMKKEWVLLLRLVIPENCCG